MCLIIMYVHATPTLTYSISTSPFPCQRFRIIYLINIYTVLWCWALYWDSRNHLLSSDHSSLSSLCISVCPPLFPLCSILHSDCFYFTQSYIPANLEQVQPFTTQTRTYLWRTSRTNRRMLSIVSERELHLHSESHVLRCMILVYI